jgi:hypothetical protein
VSCIEEHSLLDLAKEYLSEYKNRIKLDDLITQELRSAISKYSIDKFSPYDNIDAESFTMRLEKYEEVTERLQTIVTALCYWGDHTHVKTLEKIFARQIDAIDERGHWTNLQYYPILLLQYYGGISAIASENYKMLQVILAGPVNDDRRNERTEITGLVIKQITDFNREFKLIPGHERNHVPRSEYLYKLILPKLDDILFLGKSYDDLFDRFEVFLALTYSDFNNRSGGTYWGPPGRFAWKANRGSSAFRVIKKEADLFKNEWEPIKSGLIQGSYNRFVEVHDNMDALMREWNFF